MKNKILFSFILLLLCLPFVVAEDKIIRTHLNYTINDTTLKIMTEKDGGWETTYITFDKNTTISKSGTKESLFIRDVECTDEDLSNITRAMMNLTTRMLTICDYQCKNCLSEADAIKENEKISEGLTRCVDEKKTLQETVDNQANKITDYETRPTQESYQACNTEKNTCLNNLDEKEKTLQNILIGAGVLVLIAIIVFGWKSRKGLSRDKSETNFGKRRNVNPKYPPAGSSVSEPEMGGIGPE